MARQIRRPDYVPQMEITDCGAACLAMGLSVFGIRIPLRELRSATGTGRDGVTGGAIIRAARRLGLDAAGVRLATGDLRNAPIGSILHWNANHFVVLAGRSGRSRLVIYDPDLGRRVLPIEEVGSRFSGTAIVLKGPPAGEARGARPRWVRKFVGRLPLSRAALVRVIFLSLGVRSLAVALPIAIGIVVDQHATRGTSVELRALVVGTVGVAGVFSLAALSRGLSLLGLTTTLQRGVVRDFVGHMVDLPYQFFQSRSTGDLMTRVASMGVIRETITTTTLSAAIDGLLALAYLAILVRLDAGLGGLAAICVTAEVVLLVASWRPLVELSAEMTDREAKSQGYLAQMLFGIRTLKVAGAERRALRHWSGLFERHLEAQRRRGRVAVLVDAGLAIIQSGAPLAALALGVARVRAGHLALGQMLTGVTLLSALVAPVAGLVQTSLRIALVRTYVLRMLDIFEAPREQEIPMAPGARISGTIEISNLSFRYSPLAPFSVRDVSVCIPGGRFVALVGRSGSGKSTLASLLVGLFPPTMGAVHYNGRELASFDIRSLRSQVGVVTQDVVLFPGTIAENVSLLDPGLPQDRLDRACRLACVDEEIAALPMGYRTLLTEGGVTLAGGQRQRLTIARALAQDSAVLLLDEATTALDAGLERRIVQNLRCLPATKLVITHRIPAVVDADLILVMRDGRVVEQGTHASLWNACGEYRSLAEPWFGVEAGIAPAPRTVAMISQGCGR
jgi:ABC-type bacteriocin/lantibiotic exporter with double-glycine peptidase domain